MEEALIIEIPYAGLGDHLFHSHLPRIAKQHGRYEKVFVSSLSEAWNEDCMRLVWEINPYVDGFVNQRGITCNLKSIASKIENRRNIENIEAPNLLDEIMYAYGLDDGIVMHEPEIYYVPRFRQEYNKVIFDPNFISYTGEININDVSTFFRRKRIKFDLYMYVRTDRALHKVNSKNKYVKTKNLEEFFDLIYSCKEIHCFTTGTATIAPALGKKAHVYYGEYHQIAMRHSKMNEYIFIPKTKIRKLFNYFKHFVKKLIKN